MDNQQIPKADSKFQKIARKNHRKWKLRLLSKGGQKASSGGSPYKNKPDYNRAKSAPPGFGGSLEESEQLDEVIRKKGGKYCLFSKKTKRNLGCYPTKAGAMKRERQVQYFKHLKEEIIKEELEKAIIEEISLSDLNPIGLVQKAGQALGILDSDKEEKQEQEKVELAKQKEKESVKDKPDIGKTALIYGHSQAGGIGLDLKNKLESKGYKVNLQVRVGYNDSRLLSDIDSLGDLSEYQKVFLFVGGNNPNPSVSQIKSLINKAGAEKSIVVLSPVMKDAQNPEVFINKGELNKKGIISNFGNVVKVYIPFGEPQDFSRDGIHMRRGSAPSINLANSIVRDLDVPTKNTSTSIIDDIKNSITSSDIYKYLEDALSGIFSSSPKIKNQSKLMVSKNLRYSQKEMAKLIEDRFIEAGLSRDIALAAIVNSYYESSLNPNLTGDPAKEVSGKCARKIEQEEGPNSPCGGGLFGIHSCNGMGGCRAEGSVGMSIEDIKDPEKSISRMIRYLKKKNFHIQNEGNSVEEIVYNFCTDLEAPRNPRLRCAQRKNNFANILTKQNISLSENKKIIIKFGEVLEEGKKKKKGKEDRCTRIAKSKYDAWPSAYASGAVVKCRQGKIWKNIKEEEELEETKKPSKAKHLAKKGVALAAAASTMLGAKDQEKLQKSKKAKTEKHIVAEEELDEKWSEKYKKSIDCKNPKGFSQRAHCKGRKKRD